MSNQKAKWKRKRLKVKKIKSERQKNKKIITVLSTFALDEIFDLSTQRKIVREGGPAKFLLSVFKREKIPFFFISSGIAKVEILIKSGKEIGRVKEKPKIVKVNFSKIRTPFLLISTILDEFRLNSISSYKGIVFLDIQGFVRNGKKIGGKKFFDPGKEAASSIFCLKGTKKELKYIPKYWKKIQERKILIITKGKLGCEGFFFGKKFNIKPERKLVPSDTIGAGDTFFAYFVAKFIKTNKFLESIKYAMRKTESFLKEKN